MAEEVTRERVPGKIRPPVKLQEVSIDAIRELGVELRDRYEKRWRSILEFATKNLFEGNLHLPPRWRELQLPRGGKVTFQLGSVYVREKLSLNIYRDEDGRNLTQEIVNRRLELCDFLNSNLNPEEPMSITDLDFADSYLLHRTEMRYLTGARRLEENRRSKMKAYEIKTWNQYKNQVEAKSKIPGLRGLTRTRMAAIEVLIEKFAEDNKDPAFSLDDEFINTDSYLYLPRSVRGLAS